MGIEYTRLRDPNAEYTDRDLTAEAMDLESVRNPDLTITDVQTAMVDGNFPWTLVRIYTDAALVGTGEAYWGAGIPELIERMAPFLVGETPLDIDRLYELLIQRMSGEGSLAGVTVSAISGIELALHDLVGKAIGAPAYQLLGGKYRDNVRLYCDSHAGETPELASYRAESKLVVDDLGFDALKFDLDVPSGQDRDRANRHLSYQEIAHKTGIVETVTEAVGDRADIAFDCHWSYTSESAKRLARSLEDMDIWWLEDLVPPENPDVQRDVTQSTAIPIAAGENVYRLAGHRAFIEAQAVDVLAPDVPKVGGMRETRRIADFANLYNIPIALHNVSSPVGTMAGAHVGAAVPNLLALEFHAYEIPWWDDLVEETIFEDGHVQVTESSGLGITLDLDVVADHLVEGETLFDEAGDATGL